MSLFYDQNETESNDDNDEGPNIDEINRNISDYLFEGDILLTAKQIDQLMAQQNDIDTSNGKVKKDYGRKNGRQHKYQRHRFKRQAIANISYRWPMPIHYRFHNICNVLF